MLAKRALIVVGIGAIVLFANHRISLLRNADEKSSSKNSYMEDVIAVRDVECERQSYFRNSDNIRIDWHDYPFIADEQTRSGPGKYTLTN